MNRAGEARPAQELVELLRQAAGLIERETRRTTWYERRFAALQDAQKNMRDPERKMVCDILANGMTTYVKRAK